ncbi:unnamed protein product, partial [Mesorhabditis spiculigera]
MNQLERTRKLMMKGTKSEDAVDPRHIKLVQALDAQQYQATLVPINSTCQNPFVFAFPKSVFRDGAEASSSSKSL